MQQGPVINRAGQPSEHASTEILTQLSKSRGLKYTVALFSSRSCPALRVLVHKLEPVVMMHGLQALQRDHPDLEDHPLLVHNATVFKEGQDALQVPRPCLPAHCPVVLDLRTRQGARSAFSGSRLARRWLVILHSPCRCCLIVMSLLRQLFATHVNVSSWSVESTVAPAPSALLGFID